MGYIERMVCWDVRALRTENLANTIQGSGEDYAKRVLEFLEVAREEKRKKKKGENEKIKWNVSAGVFFPAKEKEETEKSEGREEGETIELYPQGGFNVIHGDKLSDRGPEYIEKILPSQSKVFKDILEEIAPVQRNMDAETLQQRSDERDRTDQKNRELEEALEMAIQAIKRLEARVTPDTKPYC